MGKVVEAVAIGVGVGALVFFTGGLGIAALSGFGAAVGIGAAAMSLSMTLMMKTPNASGYTSQSERKQVLRSSASPKTVIYGKTVSAGTLIFAEEQAGDQTDGEWVHLVIAVAGHKLHGIGTIWLGEKTIDTYGGYASYELINDASIVNQFLLNNCPSWKSDMIGKGVALLRVSLKFNADKYPSGIPNIKLEKQGREVYDPRDGLTKYSNNAALVILDYYRNYLLVPDSELLWDYWKEAANICAEVVTNSDGTTEQRYTINGEFDLSETKTKVLDDMLLACAGDPVYIGGKHGLMVGAYYGPATLDLHDYQIAGDISITPESSMTDRINAVTGKFVDPEQSYAETDFPAVTVDAWVEADGGEIKEDVTYRFVTSEWQAQRLANIKLRLKRYGRIIKVPMNMSGFRYRPGLYINLYIKSLGIDGHTFRIRDWDFHPQNGITITLRDEPAEVYNGAIGAALIRSALTSLPVGGAAMPDNLQFVTEQIGDVVQGLLIWTNTGTITVNNVIVRRDGVTVLTAQAPGQSCRLSGLPAGQYAAEVRAVALTGAKSPAAAVSFTIATPPVPITVNIEAANWSLELRPVFATTNAFGTLCEFFFSTVNIPLANVAATATNLGMAAYLVHTGLQPDTEYYYWVRAVNSYGKSAFYPVTAKTSYDPASILAVLDNQIGAELLRDELRTQIELIPVNNSSIQQISVDLSSLKTRQEQAEAILKAAQETLGSTTINVALLHDELSQKVLQYGSDVQNLRDAILTVDPATGEITIDAINVVRTELQTNIDQVTQRVSSVEGTLTQKASSVEVGLQAQRISTVETQMDSIHAELINQVTRAEFTETTEDVTQLTTRMSAAEGAITQKATQQSVDQLGTRVSTAENGLIAVNDDLQSKAEQISSIRADFEQEAQQSSAAILDLSEAVSTQNQATAQHLSQLDSAIDNVSGSITELEQAVTGDTGALASKFEQMQAHTNAAALAALSAALTDDESARKARAADAEIKRDQTVIANEQEAQAKTIETLSADFETASASLSAEIAEEKQVRNTAVESLASSIATMDAAYKAGDTAANARIALEEKTRADAVSALSSKTELMTASIAQNAAAIQTVQTAQATAEEAFAESVQTVQAIANSKNKTYRQASAPTTGMTAGDVWYDSDDGNKPYRYSGSAWVATDDARIAQNAASVQTVSQAQATTAGKLSALWATKAQVNGAVSGFGLEVQLNEDGTVVSSFIIDADLFAVLSRATGAASKIHPFIIKNGTVYINHAMMDTAEIGSIIAKYIDVKNLTAVHINGGDITLGSGNNMSFQEGGSAGFGKGGPYGGWGSGWHTIIYNDGGVYTDRLHASSGDFTGYVRATSGYLTNVTIGEDCNVLGTVYANKIVGDVVAIKSVNFSFPSYRLNEGATVNLFSFSLSASNIDRYIKIAGSSCSQGGFGNGVYMRILVDGVLVKSEYNSVDGLHFVPAKNWGQTQILFQAYHNGGAYDYTYVTASLIGEVTVYPKSSGTFI